MPMDMGTLTLSHAQPTNIARDPRHKIKLWDARIHVGSSMGLRMLNFKMATVRRYPMTQPATDACDESGVLSLSHTNPSSMVQGCASKGPGMVELQAIRVKV